MCIRDRDERVFQDGDLLVRIVDEVRRDVAAVELHALDEIELVLEALAVLDRDHAFLADLVHRFGDRLADRLVGVGRDGADLRDFLAGRAGLADLLHVFDATSFTICAPMFSNLSLSSISFATDTPSLVIVGAPKLRSRTTLRPFGPNVILTALARTLTPDTIRFRTFSPKRTSLAAIFVSPGTCA